ncbi:hypothetical protein [cf. Phormidesmis sp. LEGE 11477]|uniref:hypothetical protein n=1 Tax=cf. Phormidesmis sp. LEGE 11477 TaxID=1828680 RepID=UPI0019E9281A|nr:hypothetical protein [cf. Phormidesmis sp. LEGE 11477]MBE9063248.1 transposase family protein [cf. Phormidesmis sp. LEGE 11477]
MFEAVPVTAVQKALSLAFKQWGRPHRIRVDNGQPWGGGDLPKPLALWLIGLGIEVVWNRPYRPQENGMVERAHGTTKPWVEPQHCAGLSELQHRLNRAHYLQRERYPYRDKQTRLAYYPSLKHSGRSYSSSPEQWMLERVDQVLSQGVWLRRTDSDGKISIYGRNYSVGRAYPNQAVCLRFEATSRHWQAFDAKGHCLRSMPSRELSKERVFTLNVTRRKKRKKPTLSTG